MPNSEVYNKGNNDSSECQGINQNVMLVCREATLYPLPRIKFSPKFTGGCFTTTPDKFTGIT